MPFHARRLMIAMRSLLCHVLYAMMYASVSLVIATFMVFYVPTIFASMEIFIKSCEQLASMLALNRQTTTCSRRERLKQRRRRKKQFRHMARCERQWRTLAHVVSQKYGHCVGLLCKPIVLRLLVLVHFIFTGWISVFFGQELHYYSFLPSMHLVIQALNELATWEIH